MKKTILRLIAVSVLVFVSMFSAWAQGISANFKNEPLQSVFLELEKQVGYSFIFQMDDIKDQPLVTVSLSGVSMESALSKIIKLPLKYEIKGKTIVIKNTQTSQQKPSEVMKRNSTSVSGRITDTKGEPLVGVTVWVKDTQLSTISDVNGKYSISFEGNYNYLCYSALGFMKEELSVQKGSQTVDVVMNDDVEVLEEAVAIGYGHQKKASIVGAIATIDPNDLKIPVAKISNSLAGRLSGVISYQRTGEPGQASTFFIRGVSTFGENSQPLVLVDGVERSLDLVDYEDIKEFSILKDAAATAVYGVRGANGVVLITTRDGDIGKPRVTAKVECGVVSPTRVPSVIDGPTFATMYNEAVGWDYFSQDAIMSIIEGSDTDLYPNVDWVDCIFKKATSDVRANVNVSGGTNTVKYYVSGGFYNENGLFKTDHNLAYNTGMFYRKFNFRANLDIKITKYTKMNLNLATTFEQKNQGGTASSTIWRQALLTPACAFPMVYSTGQYPGPGGGSAGFNPYALVTQTGYCQAYYNNAQSVFALTHDFSWLTDGLTGTVKASFDANNVHNQNRTRTPEQYSNAYRDSEGNLQLTQMVEGSQTLSFAQTSAGWRAIYIEASLNYMRSFGNHSIGGLLLYQQSNKNYVGNSATNSQAALPHRHQGLAFRAMYNYDSRYFLEFNAGYNGSENFSPGHRFGFFPSVAAGWMISNEKFWNPLKRVISQLKFKGSYGLVGNDQIGGNRRFIYLETIETGGNYIFGATPTSYSSYRLGEYPNENVSWETAKKLDVGFDVKFFNALSLQFDYFHEHRSGIFLERQSVPYFAGLTNQPWVNLGQMRNSGIDASMRYDQKIGQVNLSALGNFTFCRNVILDMDQPDWSELYMNQTGQARWESFGYVADGLFESYEDIASSPDQSYFGDIQPGDIKYVDLNGDNVINAFDKKALGVTGVPEIVYGFGASLQYKGLDVSVFFQGNGNIHFSKYSTLTVGFTAASLNQANLLTDVVDNYWTPERLDAKYPRLINGVNTNNSQLSTFWIVNGRYLRLKNAEIGYSIPKRWSQKIKLEKVRFYLSGNNLLLFSPFKLWDPDQNVSGGAAAYPITRTVNAGINIAF